MQASFLAARIDLTSSRVEKTGFFSHVEKVDLYSSLAAKTGFSSRKKMTFLPKLPDYQNPAEDPELSCSKTIGC